MLNTETIKTIHERLAALFPKNLILLGGSYATGNATEESDVDIFLICNGLFFLQRKKYQPLVVDLKKQYPQLQIMLVPKIFFKYRPKRLCPNFPKWKQSLKICEKKS